MNPKQLTKEYLRQPNVMQLATSGNGGPWICTVHFYADKDLNFYWVSRTDRRHSQQLAENPAAAVTMVIHENTPDEDYVISVTAAGKAELVKDVPAALRDAYVAKLDKPPQMLPDADDPSNLQEFYRLKPDSVVLFDTKDFPQTPRQEFNL